MLDMSEDDEESVTVTGVAAAPRMEVTSIFEDDMIELFSDKDGKPRWKCKWCGGIFARWNATKAICHLNQLKIQFV